MSAAEVNNDAGRFNGQCQTYAIWWAIRREGESEDSILQVLKAHGTISKNFWVEKFVHVEYLLLIVRKQKQNSNNNKKSILNKHPKYSGTIILYKILNCK